MLLSYADSSVEDTHVINDEATPLIGVVVVIFNRRCSESVSFVKMLQISPTVLLLIDNSTEAEIIEYNRQYCLQQNCGYYSMGSNAGLSKAYNTGVRLIGDRTEYLMLLDDDTVVPDDVIRKLGVSVQETPDADVFIPFITDQNSLLSPNRRVSSLFFRLRKRPDVFSSQMSAINSGLVIRLRPGESQGPYFDEEQFLDCIDHLFVFQQLARGAKFQLYAAEFQQTFFDGMTVNQKDRKEQNDQKEKTCTRFRQFVKDYRYFYTACSLNRWIAELYLLFRASKLNMRYRTTCFLTLLQKA